MSDWTQAQVLDRCEEHRRDPGWIAAAWTDPRTRVIGVDDHGRLNSSEHNLGWRPVDQPYDPSRHFLLGTLDATPVFATQIEAGAVGLRSVLDVFDESEVQLAFAAVGLIGWHTRAGFCPRCGRATSPILGGLARSCAACVVEDYPRSDPAAIMAVLDGEDRILLARQPSWPAGRFSVLAGFAEVGESLEQTVHREVGEEVGIRLDCVQYLGSQPWPFPRSLMVAFAARAAETELHPAEDEVEAAGWYSREQLRAELAAGSMLMPTRASIAWRMIQAWLCEDLSVFRLGTDSPLQAFEEPRSATGAVGDRLPQ